ncbi:MAG TPA: hypothetical protein PL193_12210 [Xanthobacteraceae bacterium]|nr:hypothetical protein [Xanthobacteraceae bacterium]
MRYCLRGRSRPDFLFLQTSDAERYAPMLAVSSRSVRRYCEMHGHEYRVFVGIKRGCLPWHATFNRIILLQELLDEGFRGWVVYLDADAYIHDASIAVASIARSATRPLIIERGSFEGLWDVNAGVFLLNLGDRKGRDLARAWHRSFMEISDEALAAAKNWIEVPNDQELLQRLIRDEGMMDAVERPPSAMLNYNGRFVRQALRADGSFEDRLALITREVDAMLAATGNPS